jgi:hypothetical protein
MSWSGWKPRRVFGFFGGCVGCFVGLAGSSKSDANVVSINNLLFTSGHLACFGIIYAVFKNGFSVAIVPACSWGRVALLWSVVPRSADKRHYL